MGLGTWHGQVQLALAGEGLGVHGDLPSQLGVVGLHLYFIELQRGGTPHTLGLHGFEPQATPGFGQRRGLLGGGL